MTVCGSSIDDLVVDRSLGRKGTGLGGWRWVCLDSGLEIYW
jgi:hypothetical protein